MIFYEKKNFVKNMFKKIYKKTFSINFKTIFKKKIVNYKKNCLKKYFLKK